MKQLIFLVSFFALILQSCDSKEAETADTIYTNGKIYTVNETQLWAVFTPAYS